MGVHYTWQNMVNSFFSIQTLIISEVSDCRVMIATLQAARQKTTKKNAITVLATQAGELFNVI